MTGERNGADVPRLLQSLAAVCRAHPIAEKVLVVPSYQVGHVILDALADITGGWLNFRLATPLSLALDVAAPRMAAEGRTLISPALREAILLQLYEVLDKRFFPPRPTPGILAALGHSIEEIRLAGLPARDLQILRTTDPNKAADLEATLTRYETELDRAKVVDVPAVFRMATEARTDRAWLLLLPVSLRVSGVASEFLRDGNLGTILELDEDPVLGLDPPPDRVGTAPPGPEAAISPLSFVFEHETALPTRPSIAIFAAVGERTECREVLRRILAQAGRLDQAELLLADYGGYAPLLDDLRAELGGLPMTFAGGLPASRSGPARAVAAFARWIRDGFPELTLRRLLIAGDLRAPDGMTGRRAARILRAAQVGLGADRYALCLDGYCEEVRDELADTEDLADAERLAVRLEEATTARTWILDLLGLVPTGAAPVEAFLAAVRGLLDRHVAVRSAEDAVTVAQLLDLCTGDPRYGTAPVSAVEAAERLLVGVDGITVGASGPRPGHLHVSGIRTGGYAGRPNTFLLGLDEGRFPGAVFQDPILADLERERLGIELAGGRSAARSLDALYAFGECVARLRGNLTLSYAAFDLTDGRRRFPSPVLLQAHRLRTGDPRAAYEDLVTAIGPPVGFAGASPPLDASDWWVTAIHQDGRLRDARESVLRAYPDLARGAQAEAARAGATATPFDGRLRPDPARDPRVNGGLVVSASRLECYPSCPHKYFLKYVLRVEPPEDAVVEPGIWLDAMTRGSLLHDFYHRFLADLARRGEHPDPTKHLAEGVRVLDACIADVRRRIPPPSEAVFRLEVEHLHRSVQVFLAGEATERATNRPGHFEVAFGLEPAGDLGTPTPITITLPGGTIALRGKIDRIDQLPQPHAWEVWDYKTGSARSYARQAYTDGGTHFQHALYAVVAQQLLRRSVDPQATVVGSGYLFPTEKGTGEAIRRDPARAPEALAVLDQILDLIRDGVFLGTEAWCESCDYAPVCGRWGAARWKALEAAGDPAALRLNEVWDHV
jgi:RecB family exonuclease